MPRPPLTDLTDLEAAAADVADVLDDGDLAAPVPACPPWRLTDLAHHLGGVHRWARTAVVEGPSREKYAADAPTERAALAAWFREGADALVTTLRATDPDTPCWTFAPPRTAAFWFRRQFHETAMHAGDAAASQGAVRPYGVEQALDGIDEVLATFLPRQVELGRIPALTRAVAVAPTEGGRLVLAGDGRCAPAEVDATVSGPAEALLLLLWHRVPFDDPRVAVTGDPAAARDVLAAALTS